MPEAASFRKDDAGRAQSRRSRQKNDCTVRAFALATGCIYDEAYDLIAAAGRQCGRGFHFRKFIEQQGFVWIAFPAVKGERRMNPYRFAAEHPQGRFILKTAKHVFAVIDGVIHDDAPPRRDRCVYGAWTKAA
jgi:hypothetical protein